MNETRTIASIRGAEKRFSHPSGTVTALDAVDLDLRAGEVLGLLGPNGAGKTTLVSLLLGLRSADAGEVRVFEHAPRSAAARIRIGAMLQIPGLPANLTVRESVELHCSYYPRPLPVQEALDSAGAADFADRRFGRLSGGQQQRALFALALCGDPDLLVLDEPTVGLDAVARRALWHGIRAMADAGKTVLLTTHYLEEADALSSRIVVLSRGRVVADGSPAEVKSRVRGKTVRCTSRRPVLAEALASWPGIESVQTRTVDADSRVTIELVASDAESVVRRLLAADPDLTDLEVHRASLEDALLALTADPSDPAGGDRHPEPQEIAA